MKKLSASYESTIHKIDRLQQFEQALKQCGVGKIRIAYATKQEFLKFLHGLSFKKQQKIVEAVISPETGGSVTVYHARPELNLPDRDIDEYRNQKNIRLYKPDMKAKPVIDINFNADLKRIENIIANLSDRTKLQYNITSNR